MRTLKVLRYIAEGDLEKYLPCEHCGSKTDFCVQPGEAGIDCWDFFLKHGYPLEHYSDGTTNRPPQSAK